MVESPEQQVEQFAKAGASIITVHTETCPHIHRVVQMIKDSGCRAGVSINPATSITALDEILPEIDLALIMTVNPGFGGQKFIGSTLGKIARLRAELDRRKLNVELEVDGGINTDTARGVVASGATVLVAGAAIFGAGMDVRQAIRKLKASLRSPSVA
jgi:ribulose-phosphate 3-epimerase